MSSADLDPPATQHRLTLRGTSTDLTSCIKHEIKHSGSFTVPTSFLSNGLLNFNKMSKSTEYFHSTHFD